MLLISLFLLSLIIVSVLLGKECIVADKLRGLKRAIFNGQKRYCRECDLRSQCLRYPARTEIRQVTCPVEAVEKTSPAGFAEKMKTKIDSVVGKAIYGKRIATAEPPFAHIRRVMGLD